MLFPNSGTEPRSPRTQVYLQLLGALILQDHTYNTVCQVMLVGNKVRYMSRDETVVINNFLHTVHVYITCTYQLPYLPGTLP